MSKFTLSESAISQRKIMQGILKEEKEKSGKSPCIDCPKWNVCVDLGVFKYVHCFKINSEARNEKWKEQHI
jgi:hypothetical protein